MAKSFKSFDFPQGIGKGPLDRIIPAYTALLSQQGYAEQTVHLQLRFLNDLNQWMNQQRLRVTDISEMMIHRYLRSRHQRLRPRRDDAAILRRLVHLLHDQGFLTKEVARPPDNPCKRLENDYDRYLSEERGLSISTRSNYRIFIQKFLSAQFDDHPPCFANMNADDLIRFIRYQAERLNPKRAGMMVTALRSFFRYLLQRGDITT